MRRARRVVWCVLALAVVAGAVGLYRVFSPSDRVQVLVAHLPADTRFVCLVASGADGARCLDLSPSNELGIPFAMHPAKCTWSYRWDRDSERSDWAAYVRWVAAREYGVLVKSGAGTWQAVWYPAAEVSPGTWGRRAAFDCAGRAAVPVPEATVRELGLSDVALPP